MHSSPSASLASIQVTYNHNFILNVDLEQAIEFLDAAKTRLNGKDDAVYLC
jgi:hypothetical protein